jgi:hypothetical protein
VDGDPLSNATAIQYGNTRIDEAVFAYFNSAPQVYTAEYAGSPPYGAVRPYLSKRADRHIIGEMSAIIYMCARMNTTGQVGRVGKQLSNPCQGKIWVFADEERKIQILKRWRDDKS